MFEQQSDDHHCPKCQIHLRCAMEDPFWSSELKMEMADLTAVIAQTIQWE
ncbi:MAG: hypothetical protein R2941_12080 [Desulfobacterales bacterium]